MKCNAQEIIDGLMNMHDKGGTCPAIICELGADNAKLKAELARKDEALREIKKVFAETEFAYTSETQYEERLEISINDMYDIAKQALEDK